MHWNSRSTRWPRTARLCALVSTALLAAGIACAEGAAPAKKMQSAKPTLADLEAAERVVFSQFGEDGVIEKIFEVIEPGPKFAVEFGAYDGVENSNMRNLVVNHGWSTYQIEGDTRRAKALAKAYAAYPTTKTEQAWIWPGNIEALFEDAGVPKDLDLLVIDIDSNDYWVWKAIHTFEPKVVMIESNPYFPPPELMVVKYHPMNYWDYTYYVGASLQSLVNLGKQKGYELLYTMKKGPNAFFVAKEYLPLFDIGDNSPERMYRKIPPDVLNAPEGNYGRNGNPWPEGKDRLYWKAFEIPKEFITNR